MPVAARPRARLLRTVALNALILAAAALSATHAFQGRVNLTSLC